MPSNNIIDCNMVNTLICIVIVLLTQISVSVHSFTQWDHAVDMNENYRLLWSIKDQDITFEVQARTLGYVGFGFSRDGTIYGADVVVGWVDQGHAYFQDRHIKKHSDGEPVVDSSQDYILLLGYENKTHTVLRFRRKLDTCDIINDVPITNDTMRILYMYHDEEPKRGSVVQGSLPNPKVALNQVRPLLLTQRVHHVRLSNSTNNKIKVLEMRNQDVELPRYDETLYWCKMFKLNDIVRKHHIVKYEPVFESTSSIPFINHIIVYECQGSSPELEIMSRENGRLCFEPGNPPLTCNGVVAAWARGSEGFTFPEEAGYPLDSSQARFYLMETHYNNIHDSDDFEAYNSFDNKPMVDNSGLKFYYTTNLRKHDAGILSVGIDPNWRHIIPPGQDRVVSEGQCVEECTQRAFPRQGINIFGVMMRTHQIGKEVRLRHIRGLEELQPIAQDINTDSNYQEYRQLMSHVKAYPGDRLIAECTYDSSSRRAITLGGLSSREEICLALTMYYPRQKDLTTCHSLPSLPTVLHSLGIEELAVGSNPVLISLPADLTGMTLETRLVTYDWKNQFKNFQALTRRGSFKPLCWSAKNIIVPGTESLDAYAPNISKKWRANPTCSFAQNQMKVTDEITSRNSYVTESEIIGESPMMDDFEKEDSDDHSNNIIEGAARSKVSRSSMGSESMGLSSVTKNFSESSLVTLVLLLALNQVRNSFV